ncbi:MAG: tRNA(Ile)(2)-agmatinylcytidine synthase [Candidatus Bathyarchaeota archaeon]|nr:tRNA(Ile)(2)-agmatinylcytidine synthase [Candidatus Bathyarchaeota archaeon]
MQVLHIGIDDTDSRKGMCTTYLGAIIVEKIKELGVNIIDYPKLIRLNPNWPFKTRGNCAISISIVIDNDKISSVKRIVKGSIKDLAELDDENTNPGVAFYKSFNIPNSLKDFSRKVVNDFVTIEEAEKLASKIDAEIHKFKLGRGVIGALAAIGEGLTEDYTYELIAYRIPEYRGTIRKLDKPSITKMNELTYPNTFDNVDLTSKEIRISPHTPCPILYGIRAENPVSAINAHDMVRTREPIERWIIYKTNQATDAHYIDVKINEIKLYDSVRLEGVVSSNPIKITGGHVIFKLKDETDEIHCAAFEPTKDFRRIVEKIIIGDRIKVYGGVKQKIGLPFTINLEKLEILKLAPLFDKVNPLCEKCGKRAKSAGKSKGFICKKCKKKFPENSIILKQKEREIKVGIYEVPPRARRHLSKPLIRFVNRRALPHSFECDLLYS